MVVPKMMVKTIQPGETTLLWDRSEISHKARSIIVQNQHDTDSLRLGDDTVTASRGLIITALNSYTVDCPRQEIYACPSDDEAITVCMLQEIIDY